jgi:hypothetical protein
MFAPLLISWNNLNIFKWNNTYLHLYEITCLHVYEIGKTQRFQKTLKEKEDLFLFWYLDIHKDILKHYNL